MAYLLAGHIFIEGNEQDDNRETIRIIRDDSALLEALNASGIPVEHLSRRSVLSGDLIFEGKRQSVTIAGVDFQGESFLPDRLRLKEGSWDSLERRSLILNEKLAEQLNVQIGDRILVQNQTIYGQGNAGEYILTGISYDTGFLGQIFSYASLEYVNELLDIPAGQYVELDIMIDDIRKAELYANQLHNALSQAVQVFEREVMDEKGNITPFQAMIRQQLKDSWEGSKYRVTTVNNFMEQMQSLIQILDKASLVILIVLFAIVMVGITNTFRMIMFERIREIGTMRAVGIQAKAVSWLFLFEALFLALGGALVGIGSALLIMGGLSLINFGLDSPLSLFMNNGHLAFYLPAARAAVNVLIIMLLTLFAASFPARQAAKLSPAVALRTQN